MPLLEIKNLKIDFHFQDGIFSAVDTVSLEIEENEVLALIGESGCGKTLSSLSILRLLPYGAYIQKEAQIIFREKNLLEMTIPEMQKIRGKEISMVFQEPMTSLNPVFTIGRQIDEIFYTHFQDNKKQAKEKTLHILKTVGMKEVERVYASYPHELSGGMRQRVLIGMAIACHPSLIIADEPTTALDVTIQAQIIDLFQELLGKNKMALLFVSHNLLLVKSFAHRIAIMYAGEIVEEGKTEEIFNQPLHPYTQGLFSAIPVIGKKERLKEIPGNVPTLRKIPRHSCRFFDRCLFRKEICQEAHPALKESQNHKVRCFLYHDEKD